MMVDRNLSYFRGNIRQRFLENKPTDGRVINSLMQEFDIDDKNVAYEVAEHEWVRHYREIAKSYNIYAAYQSVVQFYLNVQPIFAARDSNRVIFQQYSTSAPVSFLAGWFCSKNKSRKSVFEPSAGNGLLTIYFKEKDCSVNEIDPTRLHHLKMDDYKQVTSFDASIGSNFEHLKGIFDVVITNPPFGSLGDGFDKQYDGYGIRKLDHLMVLHALSCMNDDGRAAIIIGGWTDFESDDFGGRSVSDRKRIMSAGNKQYAESAPISSSLTFFNYLYTHYGVVDMINIDSGKLYHKQGTGFPLRMILISGRKVHSLDIAPIYKEGGAQIVHVVSNFDALYDRVDAAKYFADIVKWKTADDFIEKGIKAFENQ